MTPHVTLVTIAVAGPYPHGNRWAWEVDGPGGMLEGHEPTRHEAWATARRRALGVLGRLEVPGDGTQLLDTIGGGA